MRSAESPGTDAPIVLRWSEDGAERRVLWSPESGAPAPKRLVVADDSMNADAAYRLACEGTGLIWRGDFQNARQLLAALARRADRPRSGGRRKPSEPAEVGTAQAFHLYRQARAQRARTLNMLLVAVEPDRTVALRRAPALAPALEGAWGAAPDAAGADAAARLVPLRELLGIVGAHEWRRNGVEIRALGDPPHNRIHPHYGVFSPVRGEYLELVMQAPLPAHASLAFDIGCGTGVLAALLARRGVARVVATDRDARAVHCARDNVARLGLAERIEVLQTDALFPPGRAPLVVCNPPWLPARATTPIEAGVYDEGSAMLRAFLQGLAEHLSDGGQGWLILSDLAELLGLRSRAELQAWIDAAGLVVLGQQQTRPAHRKSADAADALHAARAREVTTLWRLGTRPG